MLTLDLHGCRINTTHHINLYYKHTHTNAVYEYHSWFVNCIWLEVSHLFKLVQLSSDQVDLKLCKLVTPVAAWGR